MTRHYDIMMCDLPAKYYTSRNLQAALRKATYNFGPAVEQMRRLGVRDSHASKRQGRRGRVENGTGQQTNSCWKL